jgi:ribose transport system permease protein
VQNNKQSALRHAERSTLQPLILLCVIVLMILAQAVLLPGSLTLEQFLIVSRQASALGIITLGQAAVILVGGIDLSVGSMVMITNVFCIAAMQGNDRLGLHGLLLCLLLGLIVGGINAFGVIVLRIAPFVMTLCTTTILQGISYVYTQGAPTGSAAPFLRVLGLGKLFGVIPYATIVWLALAAAFWAVLRYSVLGRNLYAVGGGASAARLCGINVKWMIASAYLFSALTATLAGVILTGYINITSLTLGGDYVMNSLAAVLIGGNAIEGGKGGVWGVVLGAFFMQLLMALLTMFGVSEVGKLISQGLIIFTVVAVQNFFSKN